MAARKAGSFTKHDVPSQPGKHMCRDRAGGTAANDRDLGRYQRAQWECMGGRPANISGLLADSRR